MQKKEKKIRRSRNTTNSRGSMGLVYKSRAGLASYPTLVWLEWRRINVSFGIGK